MLFIKLQADRQKRQERLRRNSLNYSFQMCVFTIDYFVVEMNHNFQSDKCFIILPKGTGRRCFFEFRKLIEL
jgi:hypothetical protein